MLIARNGDIVEAVPTRNVAEDPARRYEIAAVDHFDQIRRCRFAGLAVVGGYHSHPHAAAEPSETDVAQAFANFLFVIAGPVDAAPLNIRGYELRDERLRPVPLEIAG